MTSATEEQELKRFQADQKTKKIAYCLTLGLVCHECREERSGCEYHPDHLDAIKKEPAWDVAG
jgi:hypothetical protein